MMFRFPIRLVLVSLLCVIISIPALAQYGGGGTGGGTTPGDVYRPPKGGYGSATVAVATAAAAGAAVLYFATRNRALVGCIQSGNNGLTLIEKGGNSYMLTGDKDLSAGTQVALKGRKLKDLSGNRSFEVRKVKYLGACAAAAKAN